MSTRGRRRATRFKKEKILAKGVTAGIVRPMPSPMPYIEQTTNHASDLQLWIVFPSVLYNGQTFRLDVTEFLAAKEMSTFLASGLIELVGATPEPETARTYKYTLSAGFIRFLVESDLTTLSPEHLNRDTMIAFLAWLNTPLDGVERWAASTRNGYYSKLRGAIQALREIPKWRDSISPDLSFPRSPWPNLDETSNHKARINNDLMTRVRLACLEEVNSITSHVADGQEILRQFQDISLRISELPSRHPLNRRLSKQLTLHFASQELRNGVLTKANKMPNILISLMKHNKISYRQMSNFFYPDPRSLVPFVLLFSMGTAYNATVSRGFKTSDYRYSTILSQTLCLYPDASTDIAEIDREKSTNQKHIELNPYKRRAGDVQPVFLPVDDQLDHPSVIIDFILSWTAGIRQFALPEVAKRLFIFASSNSVDTISSFSGAHANSSPTSWNYSLRQFRDEHNLEYFALENIRPTMLDVTYLAFGGDIRAPAIQANHKSVTTTDGSYTSEAEAQRGEERLGKVIARRNRWRETNGIIDSRDLPVDIDHDCATPGWECADSHHSPYYPEGEFCKGYGLCPNCRNGSPNVNSPLSCAYTVSLLDAINRAQTTVAPLVWETRWGPVKERIEKKWLATFTPLAIAGAKHLEIPPLVLPE